MQTQEIDIYRKLQQHLNSLPVGFPATESGVEIRLLKHLFTPEEAKIASHLKFSYYDFETLDSIYKRLILSGYKIPIEELESHLENMAKKGAIMSLNKTYGAALFLMGMFEYQVNKLTKEFVEDTKQYIDEALLMHMAKSLPLQIRTIPVGVTIDHDIEIPTFDDVKHLIKNTEGPFAIFNCVCRQAMETIGKPCETTSRLETCMGFGHIGQMYIDSGWAREISRDEAIEILKQNEEDGLVFQPGNCIKPSFICSCCGCCCEALSNIKNRDNPADLVATNHYAKVDSELCTGCGTCVDRCQMEAIILNDISSVDRRRCIGCGSCIVGCPSIAISLLEKERKFNPPETMKEFYDRNLVMKTKVEEMEKRRKARMEKRAKK
ncbi:MAG: ATP-binding protein [Promethearchaeota archaeon]|jgi:ferredoxin